MVIYTNGFILDKTIFLYGENIINTYFFYDLVFDNGKTFFNQQLLFNTDEFKKISSGELNYTHRFCHEIFNCDFIDNIDFNIIIYINKMLWQFFHDINKVKETNFSDFTNSNYISNFNLSTPKLILRPGIVELKLVNAYLYGNKELMRQALKNIIENMDDEHFIYQQYENCWMTIHHTAVNYEKYIKSAMTNAGLYFNYDVDEAMNTLHFFCEKYKEALIDCDYIQHWLFVNSYAFNIINESKKNDKKKLFYSKNYDDVIKLINNKNILLITPFKQQIDELYQTKDIYKINPKLENIEITTIEAYLTTYPNRKDNSFIETFNNYCKEIDLNIEKKPINFFMCSCGCYGLLLCNYVYKKYNITSFYMGHEINSILGVMTIRNKTSELGFYRKSDLNTKYKNIEKIENNCYGI